MGELQAELQRLSGTTLDATGAANIWAGIPRAQWLYLLGALNMKAEFARSEWLDLQGILNYLAGTTGLGVNAAAALITGGIWELLTEAGDSLYTESGDSITLEH